MVSQVHVGEGLGAGNPLPGLRARRLPQDNRIGACVLEDLRGDCLAGEVSAPTPFDRFGSGCFNGFVLPHLPRLERIVTRR